MGCLSVCVGPCGLYYAVLRRNGKGFRSIHDTEIINQPERMMVPAPSSRNLQSGLASVSQSPLAQLLPDESGQPEQHAPDESESQCPGFWNGRRRNAVGDGVVVECHSTIVARALPSRIVAPVFMVMLVSARICPSNAVVVPSVAELPTCQNTVHPGMELGSLIVTTDELLAVVSVLPIWNTNWAFGSPWSFRVSFPVS